MIKWPYSGEMGYRMAKSEKKMAVLNQLLREAKPIGLAQLIKKLGSGFAERTVRRWLGEFIANEQVEKKGHKRGTVYLAHPSSTKTNKPFSPASEIIIKGIQRPIYERKPAAYHAEWLEKYIPNKTYYLTQKIQSKLYRAGHRLDKQEPAGTYAHQIYNRLLIDLSYNSSRLEGNTYSLLETKRLLLEGRAVSGKLNEEKIMILNHKEAIRYLVDNSKSLQINEKTILTLHFLLSDGLIESHYTGKIRDHGVRIGGSTYIPLENPQQIQKQLHTIVQKAAQIKDPYETSLFLLIHLSYLQAFVDVNKRTARLSANIPLIKNNLVPLSFKDISKDDYTSALLAIYEQRQIQPLIDLYCYSYIRTADIYDVTVIAIGYDEVRVRYRSQRRAALAYIITKKLFHEKLKKFITIEGKKIPVKDRKRFVEDLREDLNSLDESRIAGLGVTSDQLKQYLRRK